MQPDPVRLKAADKGRPQSLNLYAYVNNDPVNFVDPTGNWPYTWVCYFYGGSFIANDDWGSLFGIYYCRNNTSYAKNSSSGDGPGGGGQREKIWLTNFIKGLRDRFKNQKCADFIRNMREQLNIDKPLVDLAESLKLELSQAYADDGKKIDGRYYADQKLIRISPLTNGDVSTQARANYYYSILLIHELLHYSENPVIKFTPHFAMAYAAEKAGLTEEEKKKLEYINKNLSGEARDDAFSEFVTDIIHDRCPE